MLIQIAILIVFCALILGFGGTREPFSTDDKPQAGQGQGGQAGPMPTPQAGPMTTPQAGPMAKCEDRLAQSEQELQDCRRLSQPMVDKLRQNPTFRTVVKQLADNSIATDRLKLELLEARVRIKSLMDQATIDNIIKTKQELSNKETYLRALRQMKKYRDDISQHPEYQKLVRKLNELTKAQIESEQNIFHQFMVQAHKCRALFDASVRPLTDASQVYSQASLKPQFKALTDNVVQAEAQKDRDLQAILQKAQDAGQLDDPKIREFLISITAQKLRTDPTYQKTVALMIKNGV